MSEKTWINKRVGVLYGGLSSEREISLKTGSAIAKALKNQGYHVITIDVGRDLPTVLQQEKIDVAFIALHGKYGEDGCIQGLLEILDIPYTGSGVTASALAMNKHLTKQILLQNNIPTPAYKEISSNDISQWTIEKLQLGQSVVVKPSSEGSSVGIQLCHDEESFKKALQEAAQYDTSILVESYIDGRELTVGILDEKPMAVLEIVPAETFYDFTAKYQSQTTQYICPAQISEKLAQQAMSFSDKTHKKLGCAGVTRVDLMLDREDNIYVLEINTIPGMTATSLIPKMATHLGYTFEVLCEKILESAS